jgi:hypothetical protein
MYMRAGPRCRGCVTRLCPGFNKVHSCCITGARHTPACSTMRMWQHAIDGPHCGDRSSTPHK